MLIRNYKLGPRSVWSATPLCAAITNQPSQPLSLSLSLSSLVPRHSPMFATLFKARTRPFNVPKSRIFTIIIYERGKGRMKERDTGRG